TVGGDERYLGGEPAVRDWDSRSRRSSTKSRNPGDGLELDPRPRERDRLLAPPAEDEGIAALEAHNIESRARVPYEHRVDLGLRMRLARDPDCVDRRFVDELGRDETVVDDDVTRPEEIESADGDQAGVAWPGADEMHAHRSASSTRAWK